MYKLLEWRRRSRAERLAAVTTDADAKIEEPYVDDVVPQSVTAETVAQIDDESTPPTPPKSSPPADDWIFFF